MSPKVDRYSIPMDTTVVLVPPKFSLRATIDHYGPSLHSGHYNESIMCCKNVYSNENKTVEFEIIDSKHSSTACVIFYELIDLWVFDSNRRVGVWLHQWRWHTLSIQLMTITGRGISTVTFGLDDVFPPDNLCFRPETCVHMKLSIRIHSLYEFWL